MKNNINPAAVYKLFFKYPVMCALMQIFSVTWLNVCDWHREAL